MMTDRAGVSVAVPDISLPGSHVVAVWPAPGGWAWCVLRRTQDVEWVIARGSTPATTHAQAQIAGLVWVERAATELQSAAILAARQVAIRMSPHVAGSPRSGGVTSEAAGPDPDATRERDWPGPSFPPDPGAGLHTEETR